MGYWRYPEYVPVAEKRAKALKKLAQLKKKNPDIRPVVVEGRTIAKTWWGKSWTTNLERYADYENRIGRGRSYVTNGMVLDLRIEPGEVKALVQGTAPQPYVVAVRVDPIPKKTWGSIRTACQGRLDSLPELLQGKFPKALGEIFMAEDNGLFPSPKEIHFSCSCPDWASMCKHVAAVLYGIGARLDEEPLLFFHLRHADVNALISDAVEDGTRRLLNKAGEKSERVIDDANLSDLFGIELDDAPPIREKVPPEAPPRAVMEVSPKVSPEIPSEAIPKKKSGKKPGRPPKAAPATPAKRKRKASPEAESVAPPKQKPARLQKAAPIAAVETAVPEHPQAVDEAGDSKTSTKSSTTPSGIDIRKLYNLLRSLKKNTVARRGKPCKP